MITFLVLAFMARVAFADSTLPVFAPSSKIACTSRVLLEMVDQQMHLDFKVARGPELGRDDKYQIVSIEGHPELNYWVVSELKVSEQTNYDFALLYDVGNIRIGTRGSVANGGVIQNDHDNKDYYGSPASIFNKPGVCKEISYSIYCAETIERAEAAANYLFPVSTPTLANCN